jgi:RNA polymerase sigma-70 factor (ECF subfamily)
MTAVAFWRERSPGADEVVGNRTDVLRVHQLLAKMSKKKREVFVLREVEQLSGEEVAEILNIPTATVRTRLFHARRDFARLVQKAGVKKGGGA